MAHRPGHSQGHPPLSGSCPGSGQGAPELTPADPILRFFATDSVEKFERLGSRFLGRPVRNVQLVDLGG